jgi:hypothetical protein
MGVIDPLENEGFLKLKVGFEDVKMNFYSLNIRTFRANAVHQLSTLKSACDEMIAFLESLPAPEGDGLPAIGSGKKPRLNTDDKDAVHSPD